MKTLLVAGGALTNPAQLLHKITPADYRCIIAVDHGYDHCAALGLTPDILMGDLDSLEGVPTNAQQQGTTPAQHTPNRNGTHCASAPTPTLQIIPFAPEKDDTDLRLAVKHALALGASGIDIICAGGGRLDHFMGNLSLLEFLQQEAPALPARMIDEGNVIQLLVAQGEAERTPPNAAQNAAPHKVESKTERTAQGNPPAAAPHQTPTRYARRSKYISVIPVSESICFSGQGLKYPAQQLTVRRSNMISISNEAVGDDYTITLHSGKALLIEAD